MVIDLNYINKYFNKYSNQNKKVLALIGYPVRHSLSPKIQNYFIKKYSKNAVYVILEFPEEVVEQAFMSVKKLGFTGLNITMPYKEIIFRLVDKRDRASEVIKSVNTVKFDRENNLSYGFNTDVDGFVKSLEDKKFSISGKQCLVVGAGGAAKSTIYGMLIKKADKVYVYNRTNKKVSEIIDNFKDIGGEKIKMLSSIDEIGSRLKNIDLIVNCTPLGMDIDSYKDLTPVPLSWNFKGKFIFDMVYKPIETKFIRKAREDGAMIISGMEMLFNQAIFSFNVWFDIMPSINVTKELNKIV